MGKLLIPIQLGQFGVAKVMGVVGRDISKYEDRVVLVTGAARGIGKAIALKMASQGAHIVVNDFGQSDLAQALVDEIQSIGTEAVSIDADVSDRQAVKDMMLRTVDLFGRIDVVVPNAAVQTRAPIIESEWADVERTIQVVQFGVYHVCQLAAQQMIQQQRLYKSAGKIAIVGSIMSEFSAANCAPYTMSKAAISSFANTLATELASKRINVNLVNPGWIDTPGERAFCTDEEIEIAGPSLPWGRLGLPEDVANAIAFLCSDEADYISGASLRVDGAYMTSLKLPLPYGSV